MENNCLFSFSVTYTGKNDLAKLSAIELLKSFVDPFVIFHSGGHEVPKLGKIHILVKT